MAIPVCGIDGTNKDNEMNSTAIKSRPAWHKLAGRVASVFGIHFFDLYYCERALSTQPEPVASSIPIEVRLATNEELDSISHRIGGEGREKIEHNIAIDSTCYVAVHEGAVTGYIWVNREFVDLVGMRVTKLRAGCCFSHSAYVLPEYRGNRIYQYLRHVVCSEMYASGCDAIACFVDKANARPIGVLKQEGVKFHNAPVLKLPLLRPIHFCRKLARRGPMGSRRLKDQGRLPQSDLYIVYSVSNSPYQLWQADLLDFSVREVGQPGEIVRLCSLEAGFPNPEVRPSSQCHTFLTPSFAGLGNVVFRRFVLWTKRLLRLRVHGRFHFYCLNKARAMQAFLEAHPEIDDEAVLLWLDPDMIFNQTWVPPVPMVRPGHVVGQYWWGYSRAWCQRSESGKAESLCPAGDTAIMFPFCITVGDMRAIVEAYGRYSEQIYRRTRDWQSEMYALVMAMNEANLKCHTIAALGTCNDWPADVSNDPAAPISHYAQRMMDHAGQEVWDKRKYTPHTSALPWQRPPRPENVITLTDQRTLKMLHKLIDRQYEEMNGEMYG